MFSFLSPLVIDDIDHKYKKKKDNIFDLNTEKREKKKKVKYLMVMILHSAGFPDINHICKRTKGALEKINIGTIPPSNLASSQRGVLVLPLLY